MSRIGKFPIPVPAGVKCEVSGATVEVTGPKGSLTRTTLPGITVETAEGQIEVKRTDDSASMRAFHGLTRALVNNMVVGVSDGFEKVLEIQGVGYRASLQGKTLNLSVGHSHPVTVEPPEGITFAVEGTQVIKVSGIDKELVGQVAANIRGLRKPEPYKGKGIRYRGERVRRKVGKAAGAK